MREANQLSMLFMLMFCTQMFGLLTELLARPAKRGEDGVRGWANDPVRSVDFVNAEQKRRKIMDLCKVENPNSLDMLTEDELCILARHAQEYTLAWAQRLFPHVLGFFPYITIWVVLMTHFRDSLEDVRIENESLWDRIPDFVVPAVGGTLVSAPTRGFPASNTK